MEDKPNHSRNIKLYKDYYAEGFDVCKRKSIELYPGLTVLVGCNGCGKTTLMRQIKQRLDEAEISYIDFDNLHEGGANARSKYGFYGDMDFVATSFCSSEGENIILNMGKLAGEIGTFIRKNQSITELWIFLDAVDSGLSIDNIIEIKTYLFDTIFEDNPNRDIYIIAAANEYELASGEKCFDVYNGEYISFKDYAQYRAFVLNSREIKNRRS